VALALGVSEASVKRWCDQGLMSPARTAGGHRRIAIHDVVRFARSRGNPLMRRTSSDFPPCREAASSRRRAPSTRVYETLKDGDENRLRLAINLYLSRRTVLDIVERVLVDAWSRIGDGWQNGRVEIFEERRGVEITLATLRDLGHILTPPEEGAPAALGATFPGDPYALPLAMGTVVLREAGIDAENFGAGLPADAVAAAVAKRRPALVWLSVSTAAPSLKADLATVDAGGQERRRGSRTRRTRTVRQGHPGRRDLLREPLRLSSISRAGCGPHRRSPLSCRRRRNVRSADDSRPPKSPIAERLRRLDLPTPVVSDILVLSDFERFHADLHQDFHAAVLP
jgi:hypothetical protein